MLGGCKQNGGGLMTFVRDLLFCIWRHSHFDFKTLWATSAGILN
jgi:hypothetical protein